MINELKEFLSKYDLLKTHEVEELANSLKIMRVGKNKTIVQQGDICNQCYFVLKGCLRQSVEIDGTDKTIAFYTEEQAVIFFENTLQPKVAQSSLYSLEESVLIIGETENEEETYLKYPTLELITRKMIEEDFGKTQKTLAQFIVSSPEERYLNLLQERPQLIQRVPQYHLASYLGVTAESLSRIRKRILEKKLL
jgi:CRP-like cAMP-binding protein